MTSVPMSSMDKSHTIQIGMALSTVAIVLSTVAASICLSGFAPKEPHYNIPSDQKTAAVRFALDLRNSGTSSAYATQYAKELFAVSCNCPVEDQHQERSSGEYIQQAIEILEEEEAYAEVTSALETEKPLRAGVRLIDDIVLATISQLFTGHSGITIVCDRLCCQD